MLSQTRRSFSKKANYFKIELVVILTLLMALNTHLITGKIQNALIYTPGGTDAFGILNLFLHPFVHVGWYHFLLDAGAFILLYFGLNTRNVFKKIVYIFVSGVVSFGFVYFFAYDSILSGFCGLSGIAHGLIAVVSLEAVVAKRNMKTSLFILGIVAIKCMVELILGQAVFSYMHMGLCGQPVPVSHAGGLVGGILGFVIFRIADEIKKVSIFHKMSHS